MLAKRIRSLEEGPGGKEHSTTSARLPKHQPFLPAESGPASGPFRTSGVAITASIIHYSSGEPPVVTKEAGGQPAALASQGAAAPGDSSSALATDRAIKLVNRMLSGGKVRRAHVCLGDDPYLLLDAPPPILRLCVPACPPSGPHVRPHRDQRCADDAPRFQGKRRQELHRHLRCHYVIKAQPAVIRVPFAAGVDHADGLPPATYVSLHFERLLGVGNARLVPACCSRLWDIAFPRLPGQAHERLSQQ